MRANAGIVASCRRQIPASTSIPRIPRSRVGDDEFWLLMAGRKLPARDRRVLTAVAAQAAGLVKQRELTEEASKGRSHREADELRRSLLLGGQPRPTHTAGGRRGARYRSLRSERCRLLRRGHRRTISDDRGIASISSPRWSATCWTRRGWPPVCSSPSCGRCISRRRCSAHCSESARASPVFAARAWIGSKSRSQRVRRRRSDGRQPVCSSGVLANLIDNALRYAPTARFGSRAGQVGDRVLIAVVDEGPGIPRGSRGAAVRTVPAPR